MFYRKKITTAKLEKVIYYHVSKLEENLKNFAQGSQESAPTQKEKYFKVFRLFRNDLQLKIVNALLTIF